MRATALAPNRRRPPIAQGVPLPAPVGGWDAISPLANMPIDRAVQLDNWVCRPGWIEVRRGYVSYATQLGNSTTPVQTLMAYNAVDGGVKLFGVAGGVIYDCSGGEGLPAVATSAAGLSNSRLQYVMFASPAASGSYLMTVNGEDEPWSFDGTNWAQLPISIGYASGSITWSQNFINDETINLNGTVITFVTSGATGNEINIADNLTDSLSALLTFLQASSDSNIVQFTYSVTLGTTLVLTAAVSGTAGNSLTVQAGYATGSITFGGNPSNNDTISLNGTTLTFVTGTPGTYQVKIGANLTATLSTLITALQNSDDGNINEFTYLTSSDALLIQASSAGVLGNSLTIGASAATPSGGTLTGGSTAAASGQTLTGGASDYGITPNQFVQVNSYMNRLWFVPQDSANVVFMQTVFGVQGAASVFPLGQLMRRGGYIMAIGTWTVDTRQNVDEYIAFITSRGEIIVYQGTDPTTASTFGLVGIYQVGAPIGRRCFLRISGDLQIITVDGVIGMSEMLSTDRAAANRVSLTSIIMNQMNLAAQSYKGNFGWQLIEYALGTLAILNVPVQENIQQLQFAMNTITGAWSRFIGIDGTGAFNSAYGINANCWEVDGDDNIFFGGNNGNVYQWNVGSGDGTNTITAVVQGAYNNLSNGAQNKRVTMLQPLITTTGNPIPAIGVNTDFSQNAVLSTEQPFQGTLPLWDQVKWDQFRWGNPPAVTDNWITADGIGHYLSIETQVTTAADVNNPQAYVTLQLNGWNMTVESGAFV